ncbi:galactokinase [candidate division KSB1 bacterium]|nr:galactokinase [candidate division KSB1 bacterium]
MSFDFRQFTTTFEQLYGSDARVLEKQFQRYENLYRTYVRHFGEAEFHVLSTPGRTELSGNHTDHNHGKVLAASIDKDSIAVCGRNANNVIRLYSEGYANPFEVDLHNLEMVENEKESTTALLRGIAARFVELGYNIGGFNACITSDVLPGSGLSSSASIEILIGNILNVLLNNGEIAPEELAKTGQFAENNYFGKPCGLMDQLACAIGGIIAIDFADPAMPQVEKINFDFTETGYRLLVVNTGGSHADLTNDYASIPAEMKAVAQFFGADYLRQVSEKNVLDQMNEVRKHAGDRAVLRALHFLQENQRVEEQVAALQDGNLEKFLELVKHSGDSSFKWLQNIYSPSNDQEQGITLALALAEKFIHEFGEGACRIHGGGFAGTILAFLPLKAVAQFRKSLEPVFGAANIEELTIRQVGTTSIV